MSCDLHFLMPCQPAVIKLSFSEQSSIWSPKKENDFLDFPTNRCQSLELMHIGAFPDSQSKGVVPAYVRTQGASMKLLRHPGITFPKFALLPSPCTFLLLGRNLLGTVHTPRGRKGSAPASSWSVCLAPSRVNEMRGEQQQPNKSPWAWMCVLVCIPLETAYLKK